MTLKIVPSLSEITAAEMLIEFESWSGVEVTDEMREVAAWPKERAAPLDEMGRPIRVAIAPEQGHI